MENTFTNLGSLVDTIIDYRGKTPLKLNGQWEESSIGNYRALSAKNVKTGQIVQHDEIRYVSPELYKKWMKIEIQRGDIIITSEAPFGQIFHWDSDEKIVLSQRLFAIRLNKKINSKYAYYYFTSQSFQAELKARSTGSTVEGLRQPALLKSTFAYPDYQTQTKIANVLSNYDKLIDINKQKIELLEKTIESVYKEWFVRFKYPGYENCEFDNGLPNNWHYEKFGKIINIIRGVSYSTEEINCDENTLNVQKLISLKNIAAFGGYRNDSMKYYSGKFKQSQIVKENDLVMGVTDMTQDRRTVGHVALIPNIEGVITADLIKLNSSVDNIYLYCLFRYGNYSKYISQFGNGANVIHLRPECLKNRDLLIPDDKTISSFCSIISPVISEINILNDSIDNLTKQRDALLPRLMSGRLIV